jgi:hypothetical protein
MLPPSSPRALPGEHGRHADRPVLLAKYPCAIRPIRMRELQTSGDRYTGAHAVQEAELLTPAYRPVAHAVHDSPPSPALDLPSEQGRQLDRPDLFAK